MNRRRRQRATFLASGLLLLLVGRSGMWVRSAQRQYALNRQLIAALVKGDDREALALVNMGADPNTQYEPTPVPSLRQLGDQLFHRSTSPVNHSPTALLLTCGAWWNDEDATIQIQNHRSDASQLVEAMLRHGANINATDADRRTPLMWAERGERRNTMSLLLDHGANVNAQDKNGQTLLMVAAQYYHASPTIMPLLLEYGADVNAANQVKGLGEYGWTPLIYAVRYYNPPSVVRLLLRHGAQINVKDKEEGWTPLMFAVRFASGGEDGMEVVRLLLQHGAKVNAKDNYGSTSLMVAARYGSDAENIRLLLRHGADATVQDPSGWTVLHCAVRNSFFRDHASAKDAIRPLVAYGANPSLSNEDGETPLQLARSRHRFYLLPLLRQLERRK